jgi:hypothetical protein
MSSNHCNHKCLGQDDSCFPTPSQSTLPIEPITNDSSVPIPSLVVSSMHSSKKRPLDCIDITKDDVTKGIPTATVMGNVSVSSASSDDESTSSFSLPSIPKRHKSSDPASTIKGSNSSKIKNKYMEDIDVSQRVISDDDDDDDDDELSSVLPDKRPTTGVHYDRQSHIGANSKTLTPIRHTSSPSTSVSNYQKKYDPPPDCSNMSKIELSNWRRQQRQQRNRLSAAASRQKQKLRVIELEQQVGEWKEKVHALQVEMQRIQQQLLAKPSSTDADAVRLKECKDKMDSHGQSDEIMTMSHSPHATAHINSSKLSSVLPKFSSSSTSNIVSSMPSPLSFVINESPIKMISRQALSQELSFTSPRYLSIVL